MKNNKREIQELADTIWRGNIRIMGILKREEKEQGGIRKHFKTNSWWEFPKSKEWTRAWNSRGQENTQLSPPKNAFSKTHCIKVIKNQWQRKNSQSIQGKEDGKLLLKEIKENPLDYPQTSQCRPYKPERNGIKY